MANEMQSVIFGDQDAMYCRDNANAECSLVNPGSDSVVLPVALLAKLIFAYRYYCRFAEKCS
jgi:hypothetical protein